MLSYRTSLSEGGSRVILGERCTCSLQIAQIDHDIVQLTIGHLGLCGVGTEPVSLEYAMSIMRTTHKHLHVLGFCSSPTILPLDVHVLHVI